MLRRVDQALQVPPSFPERALLAEPSPVLLPEAPGLRRAPRGATLPFRPPGFLSAFEDRVLYYDCFRDETGHVLLIGPNPVNLAPLVGNAGFVARPSGTVLHARHHSGDPALVPTLLTVLEPPPPGTTHLEIEISGCIVQVQIGDSLSSGLRGRRVIATMNRDNPLPWIRRWAHWHATMHGVDAAIVFDNASSLYDVATLEDVLSEALSDGLACAGRTGEGGPGVRVVVVPWPFRYGPHDPGVLVRRFWALMSQPASLLVALRRMAADAALFLSCDIDELVGTDGGRDLASCMAASPTGVLRLEGTWIQPVVDGARGKRLDHLSWRHRHRSRLHAVCAPKYALAPAHPDVAALSLVLKAHRVLGVARRPGVSLPFYHFRAIHTGWKDRRASGLRPVSWLHHRAAPRPTGARCRRWRWRRATGRVC